MPHQRLLHAMVVLVAVTALFTSTDAGSAAAAKAHTSAAMPANVLVSSFKPNREVFGFALASSLTDPTMGYTSWKLSLLSTVAFFGLHVNWDGTIAADSGWSVWNSPALPALLSAAHANGVKVVVTIILQDFQPGTPNMCAGLINRAVTVNRILLQVTGKGVDGVNVDYEGLNGTCQNGQTARSMMTDFVAKLRSALPSGSYLSVDTYASSAVDPIGFFDVTALSREVDSFFVMAYDLEYSNYTRWPLGCSRFCLGPTGPLTGYYYNDANTLAQYTGVVPASQVILGVPYYGRKACVAGATANAYPIGAVVADSYLDASGESSAAGVRAGSYVSHRDANDRPGGERWDTWYNTTLGCTRELYWDDVTSLGAKYDLVNRTGIRGVGIWTLNYGGGAPEIWSALASHFLRCTAVSAAVTPVSPSAVGTTVQVTARAQGCPNPVYRFSVLAPGATSYRLLQDYVAATTLSWRTAGLSPGTYRFSIWARDANSPGTYANSSGRWDAFDNGTTFALTPTCSSVTVAASPASPANVGGAVTITARAGGCPNPLYHFSVLAPGASAYQVVRGYSSSGTFSWTTAGLRPGQYRFSVWARDARSAGVSGNADGRWDTYNNNTVYNLFAACTAVTVTVSPGSPAVAGTAVTVTAHASGCPSAVYRFAILAPGASAYHLVQAYSSAATFTWRTAGLAKGTYRFSVWARDASSPGLTGNSEGRWDAYNNNTIYALA